MLARKKWSLKVGADENREDGGDIWRQNGQARFHYNVASSLELAASALDRKLT